MGEIGVSVTSVYNRLESGISAALVSHAVEQAEGLIGELGATLLMSNPHYTTLGRRFSYLHHFLVGLYRDEKDLDGTIKHLEAAWAAEPEIGKPP